MTSALDKSTFAGVRVIELAQFVFVPAAGAILADHGAEVIKIEEPKQGDPYRSLKINDGRQTASANLSIQCNNRGKKSMAIDLKSAEGREVFLRLIASADVFLTSIRPDAIERLGLGVQALRQYNPKLIYVRGNGVGFRGPEAEFAPATMPPVSGRAAGSRMSCGLRDMSHPLVRGRHLATMWVQRASPWGLLRPCFAANAPGSPRW